MMATSHADEVAHAGVFQKGIRVWIPNPYSPDDSAYQEASFPRAHFGTPVWVAGTVLESFSIGDDLVTVTTDSEPRLQTRVAPSLLYPRNIVSNMDDMVSLGHLHEAALLNTVQTRYTMEQQHIYTMAGPILLAVNPYMLITDKQGLSIYDKSYITKYRNRVPDAELDAMAAAERDVRKLPPHVFAVADSTLVQFLQNNGQCQSVVISGESGAGKTECTKQIMKYLTTCCRSNQNSVGENDEDSTSQVGSKLLNTNPILEALGNAKTVRNDNSSRFGKFIRIYLQQSQGDGASIYGGSVQDFLLEKSRVVFQMDGERNYHVFYQMIAGMTNTEKESYQLKDVHEYRYLSRRIQQGVGSSRSKAPKEAPPLAGNMNDADEYKDLVQALNVIGMSSEEQKPLFQILSGILSLGNIEIKSSEVGQQQSPAMVSENCEWLSIASSLLGFDASLLGTALVTKERSVGASTISSPLIVSDALDGLDALAKGIYGKLFKWVVNRVNEALGNYHNEAEQYIGILDIFGFEVFDTNSFEQLCINFANEKLQQLFTTYVFKLEQEVYKQEEINFSEIEFSDNQKVIDLIEKRPLGLFSLLDEACLFPRSSDESFLQKCQHAHKSNELFSTGNFKLGPSFVVKHSAADVTYSVLHFLAKNKDRLNGNVVQLCSSSSHSLMWQLFAGESSDSNGDTPKSSGGSPSRRTSGGFTGANAFLGSKFREDIRNLMTTLGETSPHFVRCLKPNALKKPKYVEPAMVLHQLQYLGVLDSIRIRHSGFSFRTIYKDFYDRFVMVLPEFPTILPPDSDVKALCHQLVDALWAMTGDASNQEAEDRSKMIQFGQTKIFLRQRAIQSLEALREVRLHRLRVACSTLQRAIRLHQTRLRERAMERGFSRAQAAWRSVYYRSRWLAYRSANQRIRGFVHVFIAKWRVAQKKKAIVTIQRFFRENRERVRWLRARRGVRLLHTLARGYTVRRHVVRMIHAVRVIQRTARLFLVRNRTYWAKVRASLLLQSLWRGHFLRQVRDDVLSHLEIRRRQRYKIQCIRRIQAVWKSFLVLRRYRHLCVATRKLQYLARSRGLYHKMQRMKASARLLQRFTRGFLARCKVCDLQTQILVEDEEWRLRTMQERELLVLAALQRSRPTIIDYALGQQPHHSIRSSISQRQRSPKHAATKLNTCTYGTKYDRPRVARTTPQGKNRAVVFGGASSVAKGSSIQSSRAKGGGVVVQRLLEVEAKVGALEVYPDGWSKVIGELDCSLGNQGERIDDIALGESHTVVLTDTGSVYCWGWGESGQLGNGDTNSDSFPRQPLDFTSHAVDGEYHQIGNASSSLTPWGGSENPKGLKIPRDLGGKIAIRQIASGDDHTVVVSAIGGCVYTWGAGHRGQLGHGEDATVVLAPKQVQGLRKVSEVAAGAAHCVALVVAGSVYVWGSGAQLGLGVHAGVGDRSSPEVLLALKKHRARHVECGRWFSAVVTHAGDLFTWGNGESGQLGHGDTRHRVVPTLVKYFHREEHQKQLQTRVVQVACGAAHCAALGATGLVFTWGAGSNGQLGHGTRSDLETFPKLVEYLSMRRMKQVVCAAHATLSLSDVGEVYGWGSLQSVLQSDSRQEINPSEVHDADQKEMQSARNQSQREEKWSPLHWLPADEHVSQRSERDIVSHFNESALQQHASFQVPSSPRKRGSASLHPRCFTPQQIPLRTGASRAIVKLNASGSRTISCVSVTMRQKALQSRFTDIPLLEEYSTAESNLDPGRFDNSVEEKASSRTGIGSAVMSILGKESLEFASSSPNLNSPLTSPSLLRDRNQLGGVSDWKEVEKLDKRQLLMLVKQLAENKSTHAAAARSGKPQTTNERLMSWLYRTEKESPVLRAKELAWIPPNVNKSRLVQPMVMDEQLRTTLLSEAEARSRLLQPPAESNDGFHNHHDRKGWHLAGNESVSKLQAFNHSGDEQDLSAGSRSGSNHGETFLINKNNNAPQQHDPGDSSISDLFTLDLLVSRKKVTASRANEQSVLSQDPYHVPKPVSMVSNSGTERSSKLPKRDVLESYRRQHSRNQSKEGFEGVEEELGVSVAVGQQGTTALSPQRSPWGGRRQSAKIRAQEMIEADLLGDFKSSAAVKRQQPDGMNVGQKVNAPNHLMAAVGSEMNSEDTEESKDDTDTTNLDENFEDILSRIQKKAAMDVQQLLNL